MSQAYSRKDDIHFDLSILHTVLQIKILKCLLHRYSQPLLKYVVQALFVRSYRRSVLGRVLIVLHAHINEN